MSRVITFSRLYPGYHPKAGQPTNFVEKIWLSLIDCGEISLSKACELSRHTQIGNFDMNNIRKVNFLYKHHTVRAGHRWKSGDKFSPRVWSGKPYHSKQIVIAPDIEIKKTWDFEIDDYGFITIDGKTEISLEKYDSWENTIANNDGLDGQDFLDWFVKSPGYRKNDSFIGQIICWKDEILY